MKTDSSSRVISRFRALMLGTCAVLTGAALFQAQAQHLSQKWENTTITSGHRGIAYNPVTGNILVGQTSGNILRINSADGTPAGTNMNMTDVSGGTFTISGVTVLPDGTIFACNYVPGATTNTNPLKVYRWANENAVPELVASLDPVPSASTDRFGEHMKVFATATTTNLIISGLSGFGLLLIQEGDTWTFKQLTVDSQVMRPTGSFIDFDSPGLANRFRMVAKSRGQAGFVYNFDPTEPSPINLTITANRTVMSGGWVFIANGITSHDYDRRTGMLAGQTSTTQTAGNVNSYTNIIFHTANGVAAPVELSRISMLDVAPDGGVASCVAWGADGRLYTFLPIAGGGLRAYDISAFLISAPTTVTRLAGQSALLKTLFGGSALTYEWKRGDTVLSDGAKYAGATSDSLIINDLVAGDAGDYTVTATDANFGTATATITLIIAPSQVWTGGGTDDNWTTADNWGGTALAPSGETAVFAGGVRLTPVMNGSYDVSGLLFNSTAQPFTLSASSGSLTLNGTLGNESEHLQTIDLPIILDAAQTVDIEAPVTISGSISGAGALTKAGLGTLTLSGANTHSGPITVAAGTLTVSGGAAVDDAATVSLAAGGTLTVTGAETVGAVSGVPGSSLVSDNLTIAGVVNYTHAGSVVLMGQLIIDGTVNATLSGTISGNGSLKKEGAGRLDVTSANTFTGGVSHDAGILRVNFNTALGPTGSSVSLADGVVLSTTTTTARSLNHTWAVNGDITLGQAAGGTAALTLAGSMDLGGEMRTITIANTSDVISAIVSNGGLTKTGANTLDLTAANTFTGGFNHNGGTVRVNNNASLGAANSAASYADGVTLSTTANTARTLTYAHAINGNITLGQVTGGTGALTLAGTVNLGGQTRTLTLATNATISGVISDGGITKEGTGTLTISGVANTYSGPTTINAGAININGTAVLGDGTGALNLAGGKLNTTANRAVGTPVPNPINVSADSEITTTSTAATVNLNLTGVPSGDAGSLTFRNDAASGGGVFDPRFSAGGFTFDRPIYVYNGVAGTTRLSFFNTAADGVQTFNGEISGDGSIRKSASTSGTGGITIFNAANNYSGGTTINDGTLIVNNPFGSGTGWSTVTVNSGGTLGGTGSVYGPVAVTGGTLAPGASAGTLTVQYGLDMSANGKYAWELGALGTSTADADQIILTGGELVLGGSSKLSIQFTDEALSPHGGNAFWSSPRTWTIISLAGGSNPGDSNFASVENGIYTNGTFTTSVNAGDVLLHFTPGAVSNPEVTSISGAGSPNAVIAFTTPLQGAVYTVLYKNDLNDANWSVLGSVIGSGDTASVIDTTDPVPPQRFYRIIVE